MMTATREQELKTRGQVLRLDGMDEDLYSAAADIFASMEAVAERSAAWERKTWEDPTIQADPECEASWMRAEELLADYEPESAERVRYAIQTKIGGEW